MKARLKNIRDESLEIKTFEWEVEPIFSWKPGQWMYVVFRGIRRHFTISSSPTENKIQFTTKKSDSDFKQAMWAAKIGDEAELTAPFGNFYLDENNLQPKLFIAGGIGITPFRSMLTYARDKNLNLPIKLLYTVKSIEEAAFSNELGPIEGRLDSERILALCPDAKEREWWICGPPMMVESMRNLALVAGIDSARVKVEEFTGY
jgi:ferredoxin-NADP reductase